MAEIESASAIEVRRESSASERGCDACAFCGDVCSTSRCPPCDQKRLKLKQLGEKAATTFSMCQVKRKCREGRILLVAHGNVYDAETFVKKHPGGEKVKNNITFYPMDFSIIFLSLLFG